MGWLHSSEVSGFMAVLGVSDILWGLDPKGLRGEYNLPLEGEDGPRRSQAGSDVRGQGAKGAGQDQGPAVEGVESLIGGI